MLMLSDNQRHLVCWPYNEENLHLMAAFLGIKRSWFHKGGGRGRRVERQRAHYDIPRKRIDEVREKTLPVTPQEVLGVIRGELPERLHGPWRDNISARANSVT